MSGKRNVEDIILSSRNDKLLKSIRSTQLNGQATSTSATSSMRYLGGAARSQSTPSITSPSTSVLDTLVQKVAEFEHTLNTFRMSLSASAAVTEKITDLETLCQNRIHEVQTQLLDLERQLKDNAQSLVARKDYLKGMEERVSESSNKADSLFRNEALRDEILLAHDKSLTSLITKLNDICLWSVRIHGSQEELQRRLAHIDTTLSNWGSLEQELHRQDRRIDKLEATMMSMCKDLAFYKQEVQHALKDIHIALDLDHK